MTDTRRYVIRRAFVAPLGLALILMGALLVVSIVHGQPVAKLAFLIIFAIPVTIMFVVSAFRSLRIDPAGVTSTSPFRTRHMEFSQVTALETVRVRSRVFLTLEAGADEFLIISNGYADFAGLVNTLVAAVPPEAVTEETRQLAANPPVRHADVALAWFTVAALVYVLLAQFKG